VATDFDRGLLVGILIGEGHFGGDGRQPQVTLRMHVRHAALFSWIDATFPGGRVYGPYNHGGREYLQWMARGAYLRQELVPILDGALGPHVDGYATGRYNDMKLRYARQLGVDAAAPTDPGGGPDPDDRDQKSGRRAGTPTRRG